MSSEKPKMEPETIEIEKIGIEICPESNNYSENEAPVVEMSTKGRQNGTCMMKKLSQSQLGNLKWSQGPSK